MANELRVRQDFLGGMVEDNPLTSGATTLTSASLAAAVAIGSTQHMPIILDPDGIAGEPEIVYITAHTAGVGTATILRGQEGTSARAHNRDTYWLHGPIKSDLGDVAWVNLTMTAPWTAGSPAPAYQKDASGFVHLRGNATGGTSAAASPMFTLPLGYRSSTGAQIPVFSYLAAGGNRYTNFVTVGSNGVVTFNGTTPVAGDTTILDNVIFKADS